MPTLTLYFPDYFKDENWAGLSYLLQTPTDEYGHGKGGEWVLGRHPASDLTIAVRNISRRHASIVYSYGSNRWSLQDLGSEQGTFLNGERLVLGDLKPLKIGDRFFLGPNPINVVEDEQDTVGDDGPSTIASTEPLDYRPAADPAPAPAADPPPPARTYGDSVYFAVQWMFSASTPVGKVYRLVLVATLVAFVVVLLSLFP